MAGYLNSYAACNKAEKIDIAAEKGIVIKKILNIRLP